MMDTMPHSTNQAERPVAHRRVWIQRSVVMAIWAAAIVAWRHYQTSHDLSATGAAQTFIDNVETAWWGIGAYVAVYLARPIVLFPASVLTVVGGVLFGPIAGVAIVAIAANGSAMIAYLVGRLLGRTSSDAGSEAASLLARWSAKMRDNSFETVLTMRFLFLPYDLVSSAAGALRIRWVPFIAATALGSIPGTISFVLLGASLDRVDQGLGGIDPLALLASVIIFGGSLAIARSIRCRQAPVA